MLIVDLGLVSVWLIALRGVGAIWFLQKPLGGNHLENLLWLFARHVNPIQFLVVPIVENHEG